MPMNDRYLRQTIFPYIGEEGQKKLFTSRVAVLGLGALTVTANNSGKVRSWISPPDRPGLCRATNLQRQVLFDERDAAEELPKPRPAAPSQINSRSGSIRVSDVNCHIANLIMTSISSSMHDNFETRMLRTRPARPVRSGIYGGHSSRA